MDIGIASIIVALVTGVSSIVTAIIWGYVPRKRLEENKRLQKELLEIYMGAYNLKAIEEGLEGELGISKRKARQNLQITPKLPKSHIEKRITELQSKLD